MSIQINLDQPPFSFLESTQLNWLKARLDLVFFRAGETMAPHAFGRDIVIHRGPDHSGRSGIGYSFGFVIRRFRLPIDIGAAIVEVDGLPDGRGAVTTFAGGAVLDPGPIFRISLFG